MLYPCWVAKLILRYQSWKEPIVQKKSDLADDKACLKELQRKIRESVKYGNDRCSIIGIWGRTVKFVVPRIQKLGYNVGVFTNDGTGVEIGKVYETGTYSICVSWE